MYLYKKDIITISMKIKSPHHLLRKKYWVPSISRHNFLAWVQADCSSTFLSFWTLLLLYWCGFSETEMSEREQGSEYNLTSVSMHILHTVLYALSKVLTSRICLKIKSFYSWWSFPWLLIQGWYWGQRG